MRIVSWNMGCAGKKYRAKHEQAWRYLIDDLKPDVALVQEAILAAPRWVSDRGQLLLRRSYGSQDWGSGLFATEGKTAPLDWSLSGTYVAAADVTTKHGIGIRVASMHVCPDKKQKQYLRELTGFLKTNSTSRRLVIAGDFNAARLYDDVHKRNAYRWFFNELADLAFHDCHWALHQREVASCWANPTKTCYQTDHAFVGPELQALVESCDVIDNQDVRALSDHGPLLLVLRDSGAA